MDQLNLSPMQQHELTMRQMVQQIHLGKLNMDQAAVQFEVNRKTVRHWVDKVEKETQTNQETVSELSNLPPVRKKKAAPGSPSQSEVNMNCEPRSMLWNKNWRRLTATADRFKALYYSTIVKVAEQELGIDIEKKSVTKPSDSCS